jgi:hypothetical protein
MRYKGIWNEMFDSETGRFKFFMGVDALQWPGMVDYPVPEPRGKRVIKRIKSK